MPAKNKRVVFNGSINAPSIYRGPPSHNLDKAWTRLEYLRPMNVEVPHDKWNKFHSDLETLATVPDEVGGGIYLNLEFPHQLHCLNVLRKTTYMEYHQDIDPSFQNSPHMNREHIDHCIEMLRQNIMCHADVGLITANWVSFRETPWPNFNTVHMCRDFDAVFDIVEKHQLADFQPDPPEQPAGVTTLDTPP